MSNCKYDFQEEIGGEITILQWSLMGTIQLRKASNFTSVDVEFSDKNFHRNFRANDDFKACMASMNYTGLVTASRYDGEDQYEDDLKKEEDIDRNQSHLYFKPFDEKKNAGEWHFKMQDNESIKAIAQGS